MCGRFSVQKDQIEPWIMGALGFEFNSETNLDLRPSQKVSVINSNQGSLQQMETLWGIKPSWAKRLLINAQSETVAVKKTFKEAFQNHRCLIPCSGWYEWKKTKHLFKKADNTPSLMAGIWFEKEEKRQVVILTTSANETCAEIHHRMPVIVQPEEIDYWFNSNPNILQSLMSPVDSDTIVINSC